MISGDRRAVEAAARFAARRRRTTALPARTPFIPAHGSGARRVRARDSRRALFGADDDPYSNLTAAAAIPRRSDEQHTGAIISVTLFGSPSPSRSSPPKGSIHRDESPPVCRHGRRLRRGELASVATQRSAGVGGDAPQLAAIVRRRARGELGGGRSRAGAPACVPADLSVPAKASLDRCSRHPGTRRRAFGRSLGGGGPRSRARSGARTARSQRRLVSRQMGLPRAADGRSDRADPARARCIQG